MPDDQISAEATTSTTRKKSPSRTFLALKLAVRRCAERVLSYAKDIGADAEKRAKALLKLSDEIDALDKEQEDLKLKLAAVTSKLADKLKAAEEERGKLIKLTEANLPKGDARIKEIKART